MNNSAKIAFYCSSKSFGGLEINVVRLVKWLSEDNINITLIGEPQSDLITDAITQKLKIYTLSRKTKYVPIYEAFLLAKYLRKEHIDILLIGLNRDIGLAVLAKTFFYNKIKIIYQQHMQIGVSKRDIIHTIRYSNIEKWITPLHLLAQEVVAMTHLEQSKIAIIPLGIDTAPFRSKTYSKAEARMLFGLPQDAFVLGLMGRIDPIKGQDVLIKAINILTQKYSSIKLVLMGATTNFEGNGYYAYIQELIKVNAMEDIVLQLPFSKDILPFFSAIDVFVMASRKETYGMVTIEAMAAGIPVIGTKSGGTTEILDNGSYGLLFEPDNYTDLAQKIELLITSPQMADMMAKKAKVYALEKFSKENEIFEIKKLLADLEQ